MHFLPIMLAVLIGGTFILVAAISPFVHRYPRRGMRIAAAIASVFLVVGTAGFFGAFLSAGGGLNWLPESFEWPVGFADGVILMPDGTHVVPHSPSGRVQVYDRDWRFVRGWPVDAAGGTFKLLPAGDDRVEVITARRTLRHTYTLAGKLIESASYSPASYSSFPDRGEKVAVPTSLWLRSFSHPFYSWACGVVGMLILIVLERKARPRRSVLAT
ncbi:MAG: hypothetical protein HY290_16325 [Planctomycetia bacterium]|nr:hypothetical protein [Planctomycetia bacterium]